MHRALRFPRTLLVTTGLLGLGVGCSDVPSSTASATMTQADEAGRATVKEPVIEPELPVAEDAIKVGDTDGRGEIKKESDLIAAKTAEVAAVVAADKRPGQDWPMFLGPHGTGVSDEIDLLDEWPAAGPTLLWEKRIGQGYSSPSIKEGHLVIHHRQRNRDVIECLKSDDGSPIWKHEYDTDYSDPYGYNNGPRCSPILTKTRCYTFGAQGRLVCLELETGKLIWENETAKQWKVPEHFFGAGCTPILEGELLIVLVGGQPNSGVVAFQAETGQVVWESVGQQTWDGVETDQKGKRYQWTGDEMLVSYSSPIVATIHGKKHLLDQSKRSAGTGERCF